MSLEELRRRVHIENVVPYILDMMGLCKAAKLRAPAFRQESGRFIQTLWRPKAVIGAQSPGEVYLR